MGLTSENHGCGNLKAKSDNREAYNWSDIPVHSFVQCDTKYDQTSQAERESRIC
jgi:hypothetical protein